MSRDPTARTLLLLSLLQSGGEWTGPRLAERMGVTTRTVRRDAERLRELGYEVDSRPGPGSSYRLVARTRMPPLLLDSDDAAIRALAKLTGMLPAALHSRAAATDLAIEVLDTGEPGVGSVAVGVVADAVATHGRIRFGYRDQRGRRSTRLVDPYRHVLKSGRWYLVGWDVDREDWRLFRFDRVADVEAVPGRFLRHEFPEPSLNRWFASDFGRSAAGLRSRDEGLLHDLGQRRVDPVRAVDERACGDA